MKTLAIALILLATLDCYAQVSAEQVISIHKVNLDGEIGKQGLSYSTTGTRTSNRNGENGYHGENGTKGSDGMNYSGYIWIENDSIKVKIENITNKKTQLFTYSKVDSLIISICGGNGGNGGDGEKGFNGLNGTERTLKNGDLKTTSTGNGGNGGNGGDGGNGGNGGTIFVKLDSSAEFLKSKINIINYGGLPGNAGNAGQEGKSGLSLPQQLMRKDGVVGNNGIDGKSGLNGSVSTVKMMSVNN